MTITRRVTFRLYPNTAQTAKMFSFRRLHCWLYNQALSDRQVSYKQHGKSVSYYVQQRAVKVIRALFPELEELGSHALQNTLKRLDFAYSRFFGGLAKYPRFKSIRHYSGWTYPDRSGWKALTNGVNGHLEIANLGRMQIRGMARTWGKPTTCTIVYRNGKWYASITVQCIPVRETGIGAVGLDFGCLTAVAMSDGTKIENPKFLANTQARIRACSKAKHRKRKPEYKKRIKASKRWRKATKKVSQLQTQAANQRRDWTHKVAAQIVRCNSLVATEKLNLKAMTKKAKKGSKRKRQKTGLNRSILDVGMGMLRQAIKYKVTEAGGLFVEIPTQKVKPSQTCPNCYYQAKKTLDERVHVCQECGYQEDRDIASAIVCLNWAKGSGTGLSKRRVETSTEKSTAKNCGGFRQALAMKRQKPRLSL